MDASQGILVLTDGDVPGLLACAFAREAVAVCAAEKVPTPVVMLFPGALTRDEGRVAAAKKQAERFALEFSGGGREHAGASDAERELHELLAAAFFAGARKSATILWPAAAISGGDVDLDRVAKITDRAMLVGRLVASETETHDVPGIRIETPFADFGVRQLADLALDMDAPMECCWWWANDAATAATERERWAAAFARVGWDLTKGVPVRPG